tara:strand:+ start:464 stop:934 length:471 start_codon:yes stop_codon:yes gene_type:complete
MKYILFFIVNFYLFALHSAEYYESNSINTVIISKRIILPDGSTYSTLDSKGSGTNNFGIYEIINCAGHRLSKDNELLEQDFYCNVELSNNNSYTFFMKRSRTDMDAGVGYIVIAGGTKPFEQIKNKRCNYAVSFFKDQAYVKIKCEVDEKFLREFK